MSYRLVDANALAIKYPEVNDMPCIYVDLPNGLDNKHYSLIENKQKLKKIRSQKNDDWSGAQGNNISRIKKQEERGFWGIYG